MSGRSIDAIIEYADAPLDNTWNATKASAKVVKDEGKGMLLKGYCPQKRMFDGFNIDAVFFWRNRKRRDGTGKIIIIDSIFALID